MKAIFTQLCLVLCISVCHAGELIAERGEARATVAAEAPLAAESGSGKIATGTKAARPEVKGRQNTADRSMGLPLNGTGINSWGNGMRNDLRSSQRDFPRQDADQVKPFSFTKLDGRGRDLPDTATSWSCVRDNITGLIWEGKTASGLHGNSHTYTWFNSDEATNGGREGAEGSSSDSTCGNPITIAAGCDTEKFVQAVNNAGWCGFNDWRMPSVDELSSIIDYGRALPAIDGAYFPDTVQPSGFWSGSSFAPEPSFGWIVIFDEGLVAHCVKSWAYYVRLVRGGT